MKDSGCAIICAYGLKFAGYEKGMVINMQTWMQSKHVSKHVREYALYSADLKNSYGQHPWRQTEESELQKFMDGLEVLEGVPLSYLIPQGRMLPPESLRFFCLDRTWVAYLQDGAMSIGRNCKTDWKYDRVLLGQIQETSAETNGAAVWSGFFLRSVLVSGIKRMTIRCVGEGQEELCIRQRKVLGTDVMLVIVEGKIAQLELTEPEEALCFRLDHSSDIVVGEEGQRVLDLSKEARQHGGITNAADLAKRLIDKQKSVTFQVKWEN